MFIVPYLIAGCDVLFSTANNTLHGELYDEEFPMALATINALRAMYVKTGKLPGFRISRQSKNIRTTTGRDMRRISRLL